MELAHTRQRADAAAAALLAAEEALEAFNSPPEAVEQPSPGPEPAYVPSKGELQQYKRMAIVCKYQMLECPPESEWVKHGGTLRQIADYLDMQDPCDYRPIRDVLQRYGVRVRLI